MMGRNELTAEDIIEMHNNSIVVKELVRDNLKKIPIGSRFKACPSLRKRDVIIEKTGKDTYEIIS